MGPCIASRDDKWTKAENWQLSGKFSLFLTAQIKRSARNQGSSLWETLDSASFEKLTYYKLEELRYPLQLQGDF